MHMQLGQFKTTWRKLSPMVGKIVQSIKHYMTWRTCYDAIATHLQGGEEAGGAKEFLISKMNDNMIEFDLPSHAGNGTLEDDLRFGGIGSVYMSWLTLNLLRRTMSYEDSRTYASTKRIGLDSFVAPHNPGLLFAGNSLALPHVVVPTWIAMAQADPIYDTLTRNNGHLLVGPHPYNVGEKLLCEALHRTGSACALANGRPLSHKPLRQGLLVGLHLAEHQVRRLPLLCAPLLVTQGTRPPYGSR